MEIIVFVILWIIGINLLIQLIGRGIIGIFYRKIYLFPQTSKREGKSAFFFGMVFLILGLLPVLLFLFAVYIQYWK